MVPSGLKSTAVTGSECAGMVCMQDTSELSTIARHPGIKEWQKHIKRRALTGSNCTGTSCTQHVAQLRRKTIQPAGKPNQRAEAEVHRCDRVRIAGTVCIQDAALRSSTQGNKIFWISAAQHQPKTRRQILEWQTKMNSWNWCTAA